MKTFVKLMAAALSVGALALPLSSYADGGGRWGRGDDHREWRHESRHHDHGRHLGQWKRHRHEREVVVVREPVPVYRERIVERYSVYAEPEPAVVIHLPPLVFPF